MAVYNRNVTNKRLTYTSPSYFNAYISNRNTRKTIPLVTAPQSVSESVSTSFSQQDLPGGSRPLINYSSTGARKVTMSLKLSDEIMPQGYTINSYVAALKALPYPKFEKSAVIAPDTFLYLGNVTLYGACESVNVNWDTYYVNNTLIRCTVDLSFIEMRESCPGTTTIEKDYDGMVGVRNA